MNYLVKIFQGVSLVLAIVLVGSCNNKNIPKVQKPNVLFIVIDDLRADIVHYGNKKVVSPNLDKLTENSILFENNYANIPICMSSRNSLLTGIHPMSKSFDIDYMRADLSLSNFETLPAFLKRKGYTTLSNGKIFYTQDDSDNISWSEPAWRPNMKPISYIDEASKAYQKYSSYEYFDKSEQKVKTVEGYRGPFMEFPEVSDNSYPDGKIVAKSIADLERLNKTDKPFFLAVGFNKPHPPFYAPKKYWDLYDSDSIQLASNRSFPENAPIELMPSKELKNLYHHRGLTYNSDEFHRQALHGYYASVSYTDKLVGDLIHKVNDLGLGDNTIIVVLGDHGYHLGEHNMWGKHNILKTSLKTPLLIKIPNTNKRTVKTLTSLVDIYPTLCELTGLDIPAHVQGKNLLTPPINENSSANAVFFKWKGEDAVMTNQYLYSEWRDDNGEIINRMLYDYHTDPNENKNIAHLDKFETVVTALSELIRQKKGSLN